MRRKKHKHARRAVRFYKINGGFREPYKVLLDGNFLHVLLKSSLVENMRDVLAKLLGGPVKAYITPCILKELKGLGPEYSETHRMARKHAMVLACGHDADALPAADCILSCVGEHNASHYFVGSQDRDLRGRLAKIAAGARLYVSVNGLHIEGPLRFPEASSPSDGAAAHGRKGA
eukprot:jgi/Botrbrau1/11329/Bobra.0038s0088.1